MLNNKYIEQYRNMHLCQHTYDTEKALWARRLGSTSLIDQHNAKLKLEALEIAWRDQCKREGNLKQLINRQAIDTPTESMIEAEKPKKRGKRK